MHYLTIEELWEAFSRAYPEHRDWDYTLKASCDSKVRQFKSHLNSIGFLAGFTCPGATIICLKSCYTQRGFSHMKPAEMVKAKNTFALFHYLMKEDAEGLVDQISKLITHSTAQYHRRVKKLQKANRTPEESKELKKMLRAGSLFRWEWAGDVVNDLHAQTILDACERHPETNLWIYTRSFHTLPVFDNKPDNLVVWLSSDEENEREVDRQLSRYTWAKKAHMTPKETYQKKVHVNKSDRPEVVCPENTGQIPIDGACPSCFICHSETVKDVDLVFLSEDKGIGRNTIDDELMELFEEKRGPLVHA
mgnify:FL=1